MPGKVSKINPSVDGEYRMRVYGLLVESPEALTIDEMKSMDIVLSQLSTQKMARILSYLIEVGHVQKAKSKRQGKMLYKATEVMRQQGYDVDNTDDEE